MTDPEQTAAHTPGPWVWAKNHRGLYALDSDVLAYADYEGMWVPFGSTGEANARLIAAAPDLLEALKDCLGRFIEAFPAASEYEPIKRGFAAISRAEGRTEPKAGE